MRAQAVAMVSLVVATGCAGPKLHARWHLIAGENKVYVVVTNLGTETAQLEWVNVNNKRAGGAQNIARGEMRVIDWGIFRCELPFELTAADTNRGLLKAEIPTIPSNLPEGWACECTWAKAESATPTKESFQQEVEKGARAARSNSE